jgi:NADH-quinone oxidoreductase subunit N
VLPAELGGAPAPWALLFGLVAAATMTLGNLAALQQTNVKRLLAWSSIAHAGYILLAVVAGGRDGARATLLYLVAYLFMSLGPFVVVIALAARGVGDELPQWRGLGRRAPLAAATMAVCLLALTGLPPLSGFFAKFAVFYALVARGSSLMVALAIIGVLNSALSLYYYARVLKTMYFEAGDGGALALPPLHTMLLAVCAAPTLALAAVWQPLSRFVDVSLWQW